MGPVASPQRVLFLWSKVKAGDKVFSAFGTPCVMSPFLSGQKGKWRPEGEGGLGRVTQPAGDRAGQDQVLLPPSSGPPPPLHPKHALPLECV